MHYAQESAGGRLERSAMNFAPASVFLGNLHNPERPFSAIVNRVFPNSTFGFLNLWHFRAEKSPPDRRAETGLTI
ncbi:MAG: hypothetical protein IKD72_02795 [Clostridia bacterium]|nr:hypothetical protein [Clostridia bacterium]